MFSIGFAMTLRPGAYDEYKRAHDDPWPELVEDMDAKGISIAIYRDGKHLFVHAVSATKGDWEQNRETPALAKWHTYMATLLETDPQGNIAVEELPEAYAYGLFRPG